MGNFLQRARLVQRGYKIKFFEEALKAARTEEALFEFALFLQKQNQFFEAMPLYEEALKIYRKLAAENPNAYLPDVAMTLNNLAIFYRDNILNKELSIEYASEAVEVLGKCNNTPLVRKQFEKAQKIIEEWNN